MFQSARKHLLGITVVILALFLSIPAIAVQPDSIIGVDLVFVVDTSNSMKNSDPSMWAKASVDAMVLWMEDMPSFKGVEKRYGIVMYAGGIAGKLPLTSDVQQVQDFATAITNSNSYTDIPRGLLEGVNLLKNFRDDNRLQVVVLFTDGKNENLRPQDDLDSDLSAAEIEGFPIYTVGLNANGSVDNEYLSSIAQNTGAKDYIASVASDLHGIYADIFQGLTPPSNFGNVVVEDPETYDLPAPPIVISIPNDGVVEASITIAHSVDLTICQMTDPKGNVIDPATDPDKIKMMDRTNKMQQIFLEFPMPGEWTLTLQGADEDKVTVVKIYDHDFQAPLLTVDIAEPKAGESARFTVQLQLSEDKVIENPTFSELFDCTMKLTDAEGKEINVPVRMEQNGAFLADWVMEAGQYTGIATVALKKQDSAFHKDMQSNTVNITVEKKGLPLLVWLIIGLAVFGGAVAAFFLLKLKDKMGGVGPQGSVEYEVKEGNSLVIPRDSYSFFKGKKVVPLSTIMGYDAIEELKQIAFIGQRVQKRIVTKLRNDSSKCTITVGNIDQVEKGQVSEALGEEEKIRISIESNDARYDVRLNYSAF